MTNPTAEDIIEALGLKPHIEGGWYLETFRDPLTAEGRSRSTAIYYLLKAGEISSWHSVNAVEIWHFYAGAPLSLGIATGPEDAAAHVLGADIAAGQRPQFATPQGAWQTARSLGAWSLVGCTVAPGFEYMGLRFADPSTAAELDAALASRAG